jgi:hypothetical protein
MSDQILDAIMMELEDRFMPRIDRLKVEMEILKSKDDFITYPQGLMKLWGCSKTTAWRAWSKSDFPKSKNGVQGVYLSDLKRYQVGG